MYEGGNLRKFLQFWSHPRRVVGKGQSKFNEICVCYQIAEVFKSFTTIHYTMIIIIIHYTMIIKIHYTLKSQFCITTPTEQNW